MAFGPVQFDDLDALLDYLANQVFHDQEHPLRLAISEHLNAQDMRLSSDSMDVFVAQLTRTARERLKDVFTKSAEGDDYTPQRYVSHCFWDGMRKASGNIMLARQDANVKGLYASEENPVKKPHHMMVAELKTNLFYYRDLFIDDADKTATQEAFINALDYLEVSLLPEMERVLAEEFSGGHDAVSKFNQEWRVSASRLVDMGAHEADAVERPSAIPGKPPRVSYPNNFGFDGLKPTIESLGL